MMDDDRAIVSVLRPGHAHTCRECPGPVVQQQGKRLAQWRGVDLAAPGAIDAWGVGPKSVTAAASFQAQGREVTVVYLAIVAHGSYDVLGDGGRQAHALLAEGAFEAEDSVDGAIASACGWDGV